MNIDGSDIKHLKIFLSVIDANGISNAQTLLNKDASTISRAISALETRLGLTLCERGRQGFDLTPEGKLVQDEAIKLFSSIRSFQNQVESLGGRGAGRLAIGVIDNIIGDSNCHLHAAIGNISAHYKQQLHIDLYVKSPYDLEKYLLDKRVDIALGIFERKHEAISYQPLYEEVDYLYCSATNPVAQLLNAGACREQILDLLKHQHFSARNFLNEADIRSLGFQVLGDISYTSNLEAIALLVLSGAFVGFIPEQYAQKYVARGELVPILTDSIRRVSPLLLAYRKGEDKSRELIAKALASIQACHA